jgi:uncharacterized protein YbjT (DUF2867 family)
MSNYSFKSPTITIFGGTGFLGRYIVNRLAKLGYIINVVTRFPNEAIFLKTSGNVGQINFAKGSFSNLSKLSYLLSSSEIVINCVGILNEEKNKKFRQIHSDAPEKLAILAKDLGVKKFIHISSIGADQKSDSDYAKSKGIGETKILNAFPDAIILRPSIVFGSEDQFFNLFSKISCISPILPIVGGDTKFQPVYVGDIAKLVEKIIKIEKSASENNNSIYELGGPDIMSFHSLMLKMLTFIYRKRLIVNLTEDSIKQLKNDNIVSKKFLGFEDFGIKPKSMDLILPSYLKHYRPRGNFSDL